MDARQSLASALDLAPLVLILLTVLGGCGSIVYKDAATTYVAAGKELVKGIDEAATSVTKSGDDVKRSRIITDPNCPIAQARLFVRPLTPGATSFAPLLDRYPDLRASGECQRLLACEKARGASCRGACYSAEEGSCLMQLEENYVIDLASHGKVIGKNNSEINNAANRLALQLQEVEYKRKATSATNRLVADSLRVLTEYLDVLGRIADGQTSDLDKRASALSDRINNAVEEYSKISGKQLTASDEDSRKKVSAYLGALGKLAADVQTMARNASDAAEIRRIVIEDKTDVDVLLAAIKPVVDGDILLGFALSNVTAMKYRQSIQDRYSRSRDEYSRLLLFNELANYPYVKADTVEKHLEELFGKVSRSHDLLVTLVNNPNDEQLEARRNEAFHEFRSLAADVGAIVTLVK